MAKQSIIDRHYTFLTPEDCVNAVLRRAGIQKPLKIIITNQWFTLCEIQLKSNTQLYTVERYLLKSSIYKKYDIANTEESVKVTRFSTINILSVWSDRTLLQFTVDKQVVHKPISR